MKATSASLLVAVLLLTTQCMAQKTIKVEAVNNDISNNLDLQAVASIFGESKDLEDFEMRLNDYDSQISNLDLNNDGEVDYLRVIETSENNAHLVVIQVVLGRNEFQDVATIIVEKRENRRTYVQVIGDPYMYGPNYIVEPVYMYTPYIYSYLWGNRYSRWNSPYYWGYYPSYYRNRHPYEVNIYMSNVYSHINHNHRYYYTERLRYSNYESMHHSVSRNDYGVRNPDRNFSKRNENVRNKYDFDSSRNSGDRGLQTRSSSSESDRRSSTNSMDRGSRIEGTQNANRSINVRNSDSRTSSPTTPSRSSEVIRTETNQMPSNRESRSVERPESNTSRPSPVVNQPTRSSETRQVERSTNVTRESNNSRPSPVVNQPSRSTETRQVERSSNVTRESNNSRPAPVVNQPSRSTETRQVERRATESTRSTNNEATPSRGGRSSDSNSGRR
jgi:hypothetical protein